MTTETTFRPYEVHRDDYVGTTLWVNSLSATIPDDLLPARVRLQAAWVNRGGAQLRSWFAVQDFGSRDPGADVIRLPVVPGDGSQDLRQLFDWLKARGYRRVTADSDPDTVFDRR